jgi:NADH:ubiquinone oxidoreductase subunit F (NADH-binding)
MGHSIKIADTTREERIAIVARALDWCGKGSCDNCGGCSLGAPAVDKMYQPYIDGEMEISEINRRAAANRYVHG